MQRSSDVRQTDLFGNEPLMAGVTNKTPGLRLNSFRRASFLGQLKGFMKNPIARNASALMPAASTAIAGLTQYAESLDLSYVTADAMTTALTDLIVGSNNHKQAQHLLKVRQLMAAAAVNGARDFVTIARDLLKRSLGMQYSQVWNVAGFVGSLKVPTTIDRLIPIAVALNGHFTAHPELENAPLNVTAARALVIKDQLVAAKNALAQQRGEVGRLFDTRNAKARVVEQNLRLLLKELTMALDPLDPRWIEFGFNKPGALQTPAVPENVTAVLIGPNVVALKWDGAARAQHYRVWRKVNGVDQELIAVGSPTDKNFTLDGLPANSTIEIAISAVNHGGESATSEVVTIVTH